MIIKYKVFYLAGGEFHHYGDYNTRSEYRHLIKNTLIDAPVVIVTYDNRTDYLHDKNGIEIETL